MVYSFFIFAINFWISTCYAADNEAPETDRETTLLVAFNADDSKLLHLLKTCKDISTNDYLNSALDFGFRRSYNRNSFYKLNKEEKTVSVRSYQESRAFLLCLSSFNNCPSALSFVAQIIKTSKRMSPTLMVTLLDTNLLGEDFVRTVFGQHFVEQQTVEKDGQKYVINLHAKLNLAANKDLHESLKNEFFKLCFNDENMHLYFCPLVTIAIKDEEHFKLIKENHFSGVIFGEKAEKGEMYIGLGGGDYMSAYKHTGIEDFIMIKTDKKYFMIQAKDVAKIAPPVKERSSLDESSIEIHALTVYRTEQQTLLRIKNFCFVYNTEQNYASDYGHALIVLSYLLSEQEKCLINKKCKRNLKERTTNDISIFSGVLAVLDSLIKTKSIGAWATCQRYTPFLKPIPTTQFAYNLIRFKRFLTDKYTWIDLGNYLLSIHCLLTMAHYGYLYAKQVYMPGLPHIPLFLSPRVGSVLKYTLGMRAIFKSGFVSYLVNKSYNPYAKSHSLLKLFGYGGLAVILAIPEAIAIMGTCLYQHYRKNPAPDFLKNFGAKLLKNMSGIWSRDTIQLDVQRSVSVYKPAVVAE